MKGERVELLTSGLAHATAQMVALRGSVLVLNDPLSHGHVCRHLLRLLLVARGQVEGFGDGGASQWPHLHNKNR